MSKSPVLAVGFQKTGTTSLHVMLEKLGYVVRGYYDFRHLAAKEGLTWSEVESLAKKITENANAFKDTPWPLLYKEFDSWFPNAKFIHVTRNPEKWIESAVNDFKAHPNAIHNLIYGAPFPKGHEETWLNKYNTHNAEVAEYFADRPDDYIHLRLEEDLCIDAVCSFLGEEPISILTPNANTRTRKKLKMLWWRLIGQ